MIEIPLNRGEKALIDDVDAHLVAYKWRVSRQGYAISSMGVMLHQCVVGRPINGLVIDHINRNKLDNRRGNLRFATFRENRLNIDHGHVHAAINTKFKDVYAQTNAFLKLHGYTELFNKLA